MATIRQRVTIEKLSEIIRKSPSQKTITIGRILKSAGYSESVCKAPQRVTESKGYQELMKEYFPSDDLIKLHKKLLEKEEIVCYKGDFKKTGQPHSDAKYALDMLYKIKGLYNNPFSEDHRPLKDVSDTELYKQYVKRFLGKDECLKLFQE